MKLRCTLITAAALAAAAAGCANQIDSDGARAVLSGRERDSVLARSALPGAQTVGRALDQNDCAAARASILDSLPH
jgi:hypothetical protein